MHLGNFEAQQTVDFVFNTYSPAGPATLSGTPSLAVYKGNNTTWVTTGVTLTVDFDSVTGLNHVRIATTDAFYAAGNDFNVVIAAGTVNGVSVVGTRVASFSIENRSINGPNNSELSAVPSASAKLSEKLGLIFMICRNKLTQTGSGSSGTQTLYKDDGTTPLGTMAVSDDGTTLERGELS